jgi:DNA-binding HxlR family transcriptional regulator
MRRKTFARMNCSIARALELVGEWWTMLILREAFLGSRRFHDFQQNLGIARNILSARLKKLVARGILERIAASDGGRRLEYRLTGKGRAFFPVLIALMQWGDRWIAGSDRVPVRVVDRQSGREIAEINVVSGDGRPLGPADVLMVPGPGAGAATRARLSASGKQEERQRESASETFERFQAAPRSGRSPHLYQREV